MNERLRTAGGWLYRRAENVAVAMLAVMFAAVLVQVAIRYLLNWPSGWASELAIVMWLWVLLWGAALVVRERDEIRFDILWSTVRRPTRRVMAILSPLAFLILVNVILLVLGCLLEGTTILLIVVPVFIPTAEALGIDLVHFGIVCVVNIMLGLFTPPYGLLLFVMTTISGQPLDAIVREVLPFLAMLLLALVLITLVPGVTLWLPRQFGSGG